MAKAGYSVTTNGQVSCVASTAKSILGVKGAAAEAVDLKGFWIDFDGVSSSEKPVLIEICYSTFATNSPGTNSTTQTVRQRYGRVLAAGPTAASNWTSEPTALTVHDDFSFDPNKGMFRYDWPLGETPDAAFSEGFVIRITVPGGGATVNARAGLRFERA